MDDRDLRELQEKIESLRAELTELKRGRAPRLRGLLARLPSSKPARFALTAAVFTVAAVSYAATISPPYTFTNGTVADADQVNANFSTLVTESNAQDSRITTVETDLGAHQGDASAHHEKTVDFADLGVGQAQDSQVADNITVDQATHALTAGDADTLDGLDSSAFAASADTYTKAEIDGFLDSVSAAIAVNTTAIATLNTTFADVSRVGSLLTFGATGKGMNLQIVDGTGDTDGAVNGLGNLIVGYNENLWASPRTGSHNLVVGMDHEYTSYAGLVAGQGNIISGISSSVSGGTGNEASGDYASVSGGDGNPASGWASSVSGGSNNEASGASSSVSGGFRNTAGHWWSSVSGGEWNTASGQLSSVRGGAYNEASGEWSSVSGGYGSEASGDYSSISGGNDNWAGNVCSGGMNPGARCLDDGDCTGGGTCGTNSYQAVSGGKRNEANGESSSVSGGYWNEAGGLYSSVSGGQENRARDESSSVSGGRDNDANSLYTSISGGYDNDALAWYASVSGGWSNAASGNYSSVSGGVSNMASERCSSVSGGHLNTASANESSVSGGYHNEALALYASVSGGYLNTASGQYSSVSGGWSNEASGDYSSVSGGWSSDATANSSSVRGGRFNSAGGSYSVVVGGFGNSTTAADAVVP